MTVSTRSEEGSGATINFYSGDVDIKDIYWK